MTMTRIIFNKFFLIVALILIIFLFGGGDILFANPALLIFGGLVLILVMRK